MRAFLPLVAFLSLVACQDWPEAEPGVPRLSPESRNVSPPQAVAPEHPSAPMAPASPSAGPRLDAGQVLQVLDVIHRAEIAQAQVALELGADTRVKELAGMMVRDHDDAMEKGTALARRLGATLRGSDLSTQLQRTLDGNTSRLRGLAHAAFDRQYVDLQVEEHAQALDELRKLRDATDTGELRAHLDHMREAVEAHLHHARGLQGHFAAL